MKACLTTKPMYCSREYQPTTRIIQQYEKSTSNTFCMFLKCKKTCGGNKEPMEPFGSKYKFCKSYNTTQKYFKRGYLVTIQNNSSKKRHGHLLVSVSQAHKIRLKIPRGYASINRQLLAIVFACKHLHTYLYGTSFLVKSDQKHQIMIARSMTEQIISSEWPEARALLKVLRNGNREKCRAVHNKYLNDEETEATTKEFFMVRSKIFNFHSVRYVTTAKLKAKILMKKKTCKYKIHTSSDGNVMPSRI